jgi:DNA-binding response OmpR family regulator
VGKRSALIAGADLSILQLVRMVLEFGDFDVTEAGSHGEALTRVDSADRPPHLVVLDVSLPDFAGLPTLRALRGEQHLTELPIIVLTALTDPPEHQPFLESGATVVVTKPFSSHGLLEVATQLARPE